MSEPVQPATAPSVSAPTATAAAMIAAARECLDTPFHHLGRQPGVAMDCVGLVLVALAAAGLHPVGPRTYSRHPDGRTLFRLMRGALGAEVEPGGAVEDTPGAVLGFAMRGQPCHVGVRTDWGLIHALAPRGRGDFLTKVQELNFDERWRKRCVAVWLVPGVGADVSGDGNRG